MRVSLAQGARSARSSRENVLRASWSRTKTQKSPHSLLTVNAWPRNEKSSQISVTLSVRYSVTSGSVQAPKMLTELVPRTRFGKPRKLTGSVSDREV
jgi:hypothetical protein